MGTQDEKADEKQELSSADADLGNKKGAPQTKSKATPSEPKEDLLPKEAVEFCSKDRLTCTALDALGHTPKKVERNIENGKPVLYYHFLASAWPDWDKYRRGEKLFVAIRDYEEADKRFKNNLYEDF